MDDPDLFFLLTPLASFSDRYAILQNHDDLDEAKYEATRLLVQNGISQRTDSRAFSLQLRIAHILHNQGSLDEAAEIRRSVLHQRRQHARREGPQKMSETLMSYAQSLMVLDKTNESRALLIEALEICESTFGPEDSNTLQCKKAMAELYRIEGRTTEAIDIGFEVLRILEESGDPLSAIGTMSDLAVYLALASREKESIQMLHRASSLATEHLPTNDAASLSIALNITALVAATGKDGQIVACLRGGRVIAGRSGGPVVATQEAPRVVEKRTLISSYHSLWKTAATSATSFNAMRQKLDQIVGALDDDVKPPIQKVINAVERSCEEEIHSAAREIANAGLSSYYALIAFS
ncbi:hypothetical protein Q7P37_009857 [Cladosporium fusiforme]